MTVNVAHQFVIDIHDAGGASLGASPVEVDWRPASWELRLDVRYIGVRYPVPAPVNALDPYWTLGLQLRRRFRLGAWSITPRLTVNRLTDNQDSLIFGYPEAGRTVRLEIIAGVE